MWYASCSFVQGLSCFDNWWLIRVTLVVDLVFLPQNFGLVVGTYKDFLLFCECPWGSGSLCRWWGHLIAAGGNQMFCGHR